MKPQKLSWVTIPLLIMVILNAIGGLLLIVAGPSMSAAMMQMGDPNMTGAGELSRGLMLGAGLLTLAAAVFTFVVRNAVIAGKNWGRIAAIVLFALNLLSFPLGTILGIFGLIGALDQEVQRYTSR
ncbi:hypothetical protein [Deinococcus peraridilitoris]|uniref:DUF4064 domain-containing protein n=1 Tax=Deinococcus peraridilitoris (strain DSM 19664 / LMG 22246 / CIP 109416 / KR-200) TaxID=937777 RepID=L0A3K8_DEIPD|nr:hypothetical protein [Deinococcus peraridilitoris]AFZ68483.1 hypothetical protein Deipe_3034 [Deinococcus peraridilitoris DSM 19664]